MRFVLFQLCMLWESYEPVEYLVGQCLLLSLFHGTCVLNFWCSGAAAPFSTSLCMDFDQDWLFALG